MSFREAVDPRTLEFSEKILEAWRIPAAIDLFCRRGAKSGAALAAEARRGGWGLTAPACWRRKTARDCGRCPRRCAPTARWPRSA